MLPTCLYDVGRRMGDVIFAKIRVVYPREVHKFKPS